MSLYKLIEDGEYEKAIEAIENGADLSELGGYMEDEPVAWIAAEKGQLDILKLIKEKGGDLNAPNKNGKGSALLRACGYGHIECIEYLLVNGVGDVDVGFRTAAAGGHLGAVKYFVEERNVDIDKQEKVTLQGITDIDTVSDTALGRAAGTDPADSESLEVVKYLVSKGADVNLQGRLGNTALHRAAISDDTIEIAQFLLEHGADKTIKNDQGKTPFQFADPKYAKAVKRLLRVKKS